MKRRTTPSELLIHPYANVFPLLQGAEFEAFADDIAKHGLREPIVLYEKKTLDGRNRLRACHERKVEPRFVEFTGDDPLAFVISANLQRRHLDTSQRAMVADAIATLPQGRPVEKAENSAFLPTQVEAAALLNVDRRTVQHARKVRSKGDPALIAAVENGDITVSVAANLADLPKAEQRKAVKQPKRAKTVAKQHKRKQKEKSLASRTKAASAELGVQQYGVIYADPPWRFEPWSRETGMDRAADNHYPTMDTLAITQMSVPAAQDCVLFLWATAPMLPQALQVMQAWGFAYKSHCVWGKPHIGQGHWFRNKHEMLLVGTRGDVPAPAEGEQYDSLILLDSGEHSAKPNGFAEMIEALFPNVPKLEMFARSERLGWDVWGNEVK